MLALCEPEQRKAGQRLAAVLTARGVRGFGFGVFAAQAMDLGLLIQRIRREARVIGERHALARRARGRDRLGPLAAELHQLGAVHEARAGEALQLRLRIAPRGQRGRPLARAVERVDAGQRRDHVAVDQAGHGRRQLVRRRLQHDVVEHRQARLQVRAPQEHARMQGARERDQVALTKLLADRERLLGQGLGRIELAGHDLHDRRGQEHVAALHAVALAVEDALDTGEPGLGTGSLAARHQPESEPEARARSSQLLPLLHTQVVSPLEGPELQLGIVDEACGMRESLEVVDSERRERIGRHK
jgi:hypothetical protein